MEHVKGVGVMIEEDLLLSALRAIAPGTLLREGLDNVLRAKTGALIVISDTPKVMEIVEGGFALDCDFSPAALYELAKMDGAIILSKDGKRIIYANAELVPNAEIPSSETGIRHRAAERTARQTDEIVVAISQRRSIITLYRGDMKFILRDFSELTAKANQAISTLEKYRDGFDRVMTDLSAQEFRDTVTVFEVVHVLQRAEMLLRAGIEVKRYIVELGSEGRHISMQLVELTSNVDEEVNLVIKDYRQSGDSRNTQEIRKHLRALTLDEMADLVNICRVLGHGASLNALDQASATAGYRLLSKIQRIPKTTINNLVRALTDFQGILQAPLAVLEEVEGIGEVRARVIKSGIERLREQVINQRH
ncbi:MAG: DNA integrity scanning diadenylate cyclase DisA [bacterium]|nr:DNA integrity scanning diadenylate cyclase DisA [bacterium]